MKLFWKSIGVFIVLLLTFSLAMADSPVNQWEKVLETNESSSKTTGFLNESFGISVGNEGEIEYSVDGGQSWQNGTNKAFTLAGLEILDPKNIWCCGDGAQVRASQDGGKTWQALADFGPPYFRQDTWRSFPDPVNSKFLSFINAQIGWIATPKRLAVTPDGGKSWRELKLPDGLKEITAISLCTPEEGYLVEDIGPGKLFVTRDGGKSWSSQQLELKGEEIPKTFAPMTAVRFTDSQKGIIITNRKGGKMWAIQTEDGGKTWNEEAVPGRFGSLFLTHDGKMLTITGMYGDILVLRRR